LATATRSLARLVPNLITLSGLGLGLLSIFFAFGGRPVAAAWLITACVMLDKLDGTAARLLNAGSDLGVQLDSFSDFITFCVAPGMLVMALLTGDGGSFAGWPQQLVPISSAISYVVLGALRLARFNCGAQDGTGMKLNFEGIPTTTCGALVATLVLVLAKYDLLLAASPCLPLILVLCGAAMVSRLLLPKVVRFRRRWLNWFVGTNAAIVATLILVRSWPEYLLFLVLLYLAVGLTVANRKGYEAS